MKRTVTGSCVALVLFLLAISPGVQSEEKPGADPKQMLLKDYKPVSLHKVPVTQVTKARTPAIDIHSHPMFAKTSADIDRWVKTMDAVGVEKSVLLAMASGKEFDGICEQYSKYLGRFELWCGFDYNGYDQPGWGDRAVAELERCVKLGARGVGEEGDKGKGLSWGKAAGMHLDDPRMDPLLEKCADLKIPINVHVADPIWMYQKMDATNDGLMNAYSWRLDNQPEIVGHSGMIDILERAVKRHPRTLFIACHFANLDYDLARLGQCFETDTRTCMSTSQPDTQRLPSSPASPPSSTKNIKTACSTEPTWSPIGTCTTRLLESWRVWTSTSTRRCSITIGAILDLG